MVRPELYLLGRRWSAFHVCGVLGLLLASVFALSLVMHQGLSPWVLAGIGLLAVAILLGLTLLTKIVTGEERIINYHHQITVIGGTCGLLVLLEQPVLPYLDVTLLGVGLFIACGRVGCLMHGCCHGCPHQWGVCYGDAYAHGIFPSYYLYNRLFPVQAAESLWLIGVVFVGTLLILGGHAPGAALSWYLVAYASGRFLLEFRRGDPRRSFPGGFSEAQWTSLVIAGAVVAAGALGVVPFQPWYAGAAAGIAGIMVGVAARRGFRRDARHRLLHPRHVQEIAAAVSRLQHVPPSLGIMAGSATSPHAIHVARTSLGLQLSTSHLLQSDGMGRLYTFSMPEEPLTAADARALADLLMHVHRAPGTGEVRPGRAGLYHLLMYPDRGPHSSADGGGRHREQDLMTSAHR